MRFLSGLFITLLLCSIIVFSGLKHIINRSFPEKKQCSSGVCSPDKAIGKNKRTKIKKVTEPRIKIASGIAALTSLAMGLTKNTRIEIVPFFSTDTRLQNQKVYLQGKNSIPEPSNNIDAVLSIRGAWPADPLFPELRSGNIGVIEIDCASPVEHDRRKLPLLTSPKHNEKELPQVWLSLSNCLRIVDIMAEDFCRLSPGDKIVILKNQDLLKRRILKIYSKYQEKFSNCENVGVVALCDNFAYLTSDFQLDVAGYMYDGDFEWNDSNLKKLRGLMRENEVKVVLHKWEPDKKVKDIIRKAGAGVVVLDPLDNGGLDTKGFLKRMEVNLEKISSALK